MTSNPFHTAQPISRIRGKILGRLEFLFVQGQGENGHRTIVTRWDFSRVEKLRDSEIFVPAMEAAYCAAARTAKKIRARQKRLEAGNARAARIQEERRAEAAKNSPPTKPEINLTIKRKWLDAIVYGGKREEYRDTVCKPFLRLLGESRDHFPVRTVVAIFRAGYTMDAQSAAVEATGIRFVQRGTPRHPEWGEPSEPHLALSLGRVFRVGKYADVKAWLAPLLPDFDLAKEGGRP